MSLPSEETVGISTATTWMVRWERSAWASVTINETTGEISIHSDFGDYQYRWNVAAVEEDTLRAFFLACDVWYLTGKFSVNLTRDRCKELDSVATGRAFREELIRLRRDGSLDRDAARQAWDDIDCMLDALDDGTEIPESWDGIDDCGELISEKPTHRLHMLKTDILPRLQRAVRSHGV